MNDIVINKIQSIQRCIQRAREEYAADPDTFANNYTRQDAAILNVLRACEQTIDLANHLVKEYKMGIPTASAESFELLQAQKVIDKALAQRLRRMVSFRNTVVHHYQRLEMDIVKGVITSGLDDLILFGQRVLEFFDVE
jgi:uncharacterized protein YutE (UPF0331/DUF86 family)